ncbi:coiled-coil domain-containing protein 186-like isoform X2 [Sycon ciliatum]|uniref:coiled-coil domain-containing protein 186-like isoform X2 n=1 Tax=Sycon ciliatum TaxID=27933 RepID=UPI0031F713C5
MSAENGALEEQSSAAVSTEVEDLKTTHALQQELNANKLRDLTSANNELKQRVDSLVADLESRSKELEESRRHHAQHSQEAESKHGQLMDDLQQLRSSLSVKESAAEDARNECEAEHGKHQEQLASMRKELEQRHSEQEKSLTSAQNDLKKHLEKEKEKTAAAEKEAASLRDQVAAKEEERQSAVQEKGKAERLTQQFRQEAEKAKGEAKSLETEVHKWQTNYESVQTLLNDTQKQTEKGKDDVKSQFIKLSWAQNKLKAETEAHKETKSKLDTTSKHLSTVQEEMSKLRKDYDKTMTDVQNQSMRSSTQLDGRIREIEAELKKKVEENDIELQAHKVTAQQLLDTQSRLKTTSEELSAAKTSVEEKTSQVEELQQNVSKEHDRFEDRQRECERLNSRISEIGELRQQLTQERERVTTLSSELGEVLASRSELEGEVGERQQREGEMLSFHQRMAAMNAELQSQNNKISDDLLAIRNSHSDLKVEHDHLAEERSRLQREFENLQQQYKTEVSKLSAKVDDKTKAVEQLTVLLDDERGEVRVLKRKNTASVKDLTRQLLQARKTVDALKTGELDVEELRLQSGISSGSSAANRGATIQRYASDMDISTSSYGTEIGVSNPDAVRGNSAPPPASYHRTTSPSANPASTSSSQRIRSLSVGRVVGPEQRTQHQTSAGPASVSVPTSTERAPDIDSSNLESVSIQRPPAVIEKERRMLLSKIGSLQNSHASKDEKMEFMESHIIELTEEIRRKTRAIQCLVLRQDSGSISPASLDSYKLQAGPQRGIMASVFHSRKVDQKMTLNLSLEINSKMQAVLEDLLIKNMTLKDNLSTLGQEVADLLAVIKHHNIRVPRKF